MLEETSSLDGLQRNSLEEESGSLKTRGGNDNEIMPPRTKVVTGLNIKISQL
jgi:hypothetical protein